MEDELVIGIPSVTRLRVEVTEPQIVVIPIEIEDVRVAIAVHCVHHAISVTADLTLSQKNRLYFMRDRESSNTAHQVYSFL